MSTLYQPTFCLTLFDCLWDLIVPQISHCHSWGNPVRLTVVGTHLSYTLTSILTSSSRPFYWYFQWSFWSLGCWEPSPQGSQATASRTATASLSTVLSPWILQFKESYKQVICRKLNLLQPCSWQFLKPTLGCWDIISQSCEELFLHSSTNKIFVAEEDPLSLDLQALQEKFQVLVFKKVSVLEDCKVLKLSYKPFLSDLLRTERSLSVFDFLVDLVSVPSPVPPSSSSTRRNFWVLKLATKSTVHSRQLLTAVFSPISDILGIYLHHHHQQQQLQQQQQRISQVSSQFHISRTTCWILFIQRAIFRTNTWSLHWCLQIWLNQIGLWGIVIQISDFRFWILSILLLPLRLPPTFLFQDNLLSTFLLENYCFYLFGFHYYQQIELPRPLGSITIYIVTKQDQLQPRPTLRQILCQIISSDWLIQF